jgi:hypothetical protein
MRFLLALMALGLLCVAPQASACQWFGTQLECDLGGRQLLIGTQAVAAPAYAGAFRPQRLQGNDGLLDRGVHTSPLRLDVQNVGGNPGLCHKFGNEIYCY